MTKHVKTIDTLLINSLLHRFIEIIDSFLSKTKKTHPRVRNRITFPGHSPPFLKCMIHESEKPSHPSKTPLFPFGIHDSDGRLRQNHFRQQQTLFLSIILLLPDKILALTWNLTASLFPSVLLSPELRGKSRFPKTLATILKQ
jgi:hypothetical protein